MLVKYITVYLVIFILVSGCNPNKTTVEINSPTGSHRVSNVPGFFVQIEKTNKKIDIEYSQYFIDYITSRRSPYNILYINVNNSNKNTDKIEKQIMDFGESLKEYATIFGLKNFSVPKKRMFFVTILNDIKINYEFYNSPFLVFFKFNKNTNKNTPYAVIPLSNTSQSCMNELLSRVSKKIYSKKIGLELVDSLLEETRMFGCTELGQSNKTYHHIINRIIDIVRGLF